VNYILFAMRRARLFFFSRRDRPPSLSFHYMNTFKT